MIPRNHAGRDPCGEGPAGGRGLQGIDTEADIETRDSFGRVRRRRHAGARAEAEDGIGDVTGDAASRSSWLEEEEEKGDGAARTSPGAQSKPFDRFEAENLSRGFVRIRAEHPRSCGLAAGGGMQRGGGAGGADIVDFSRDLGPPTAKNLPFRREWEEDSVREEQFLLRARAGLTG